MASTYLSLHYHIVFSTKHRQPLLLDSWSSRIHEYLGGIVRGLGGIPEAINGWNDHVHFLRIESDARSRRFCTGIEKVWNRMGSC